MQPSNAAIFAFPPKFNTKTCVALLVFVASLCAFLPKAAARPANTTTTLSVSPSSVNAGTAVTLTATVVLGLPPVSLVPGNSFVTRGIVTFCDASAPHCEDSAILGTAQLTSTGTASLKVVLGVGTYSIKAVFQSSQGYLSSTSSAQTLTVIGIANYLSGTFIAESGSVGNYTLTATVDALGKPSPSGTVSFLDTSNGNLAIASAVLDPATLAFNFTGFGSSVPVGNNPQASAVGDFNGDGTPDIVVTNSADNTVGVLLGNGDGTFATQVTYPVDANPTAIAVSDLNGDGISDLVIANHGDSCEQGTVSILLGAGDGTFLQERSFGVGYGTDGIALGDFNGDGQLDVVAANGYDNTISILLGNGDGSLQTQVTNSVGSQPVGIVVGDLNHDQAFDVVVTNQTDGTVSVLLGNGDGTFQSQVTYQIGNGAFAAALGDFNGDGVPDLAVAEGQGDNVNVLLGNGDGTFLPQVAYPGGHNSQSLAVGDFNGDGFSDIAMLDEGDGSANVSVLLGIGDGTFHSQTLHSVDAGAASIALGDFNGDGLLDMETVSSSLNTVTLLFGFDSQTATATGVSVIGLGTHNVLASYPGDVSHAASQSQTVPLSGTGLSNTSTVLTASPNPATASQAVTFTATVSPSPTTGTVSFYSGTTLLGTGTVNPSGIASFSTSSLISGSYIIAAVYSGNANFATSTSTPLSLTVTNAPTYTITAPPTPVTVAPGGTATFNITVPPVGGAFNNVVTMSASGLPTGATASFNPSTVTPGTTGAPTILSIQTSAQTANLPAQHNQIFPFTALTLAAGMCVMAGKRKHIAKSLYILLAFATLGGGTLILTGCDGGLGKAAQPQNHSYVITVTGTSGSQHASTTVTLIVQ